MTTCKLAPATFYAGCTELRCECDDSGTSPRAPRAWPICREICRPAYRFVEGSRDLYLADASDCASFAAHKAGWCVWSGNCGGHPGPCTCRRGAS